MLPKGEAADLIKFQRSRSFLRERRENWSGSHKHKSKTDKHPLLEPMVYTVCKREKTKQAKQKLPLESFLRRNSVLRN